MDIIQKKFFWIAFLSFLGALYSGMLTYSKLTSGTCSFGAICPYFLGLPVCVYGLGGFSVIILVSILSFFNKRNEVRYLNSIYWIGLIGFMFALYFLVQELFVLDPPLDGRKITLGYPSCLYGLIVFGLAFTLSRHAINKNLKDRQDIS